MKLRRFVSYYWTFFKHLGDRVWETRGRELVSALILAVVTFGVSYVLKQVDALTALEIGTLSLVGWLCVFAFGHVINAPVLLHSKEAHSKAQGVSWGFGILGAFILIIIAISIITIAMWWWMSREPKIAIPSADPSHLKEQIEQDKQEIANLKLQIPSEGSLKIRSRTVADEYEAFWRAQPKSPVCTQTSSMTPEEQRKAIEPCGVWFNKRQADYERLLAPRVMEIVAEFKAKGVDVLNIENCATTGFCGIPLSVQLRAFSLRLDAEDHLKR